MTFHEKHANQNWGPMIAGIYLVPAVSIALIITILLAIGSYFVNPIYEATTTLTLDNNLSEVLKGLKTPFPSTAADDFIRVEYFATNTLGVMSYPEIAQDVIDTFDLKDGSGKKISPDDLLTDNGLTLSLSDPGKGISIEWVADTQLFAVKGFARSPEEAAELSEAYTKCFLDYNRNMSNSTLDAINERLISNNKWMKEEVAKLESSIKEVRVANNVFDIDNIQSKLSSSILTIDETIVDATYAEEVYQAKREYLSSQIEKFKILEEYEKTMQINPGITSLQSTIRTLLSELREAAVEYTPSHPTYKILEEKIKVSRELLAKEAKTIAYETKEKKPLLYDELLERMIDLSSEHLFYDIYMTHLEKLKASYRERLAELVVIENQITELEEKKSNISTSLTNNINDMSWIRNLRGKNIPLLQVVSRTNPNIQDKKSLRSFPKRKILVVLTFSASIFLIFFYLFAREIQAETLYRSWQLSPQKNRNIVELPDSEFSSFDNQSLAEICRNIHSVCVASRKSKIVRVTGAFQGSGQEAVASAIAWYLNRFGNEVVLLDGDIIRGKITKNMGLDGRIGLQELLSGNADIADIVYRVDDLDIKVIPVGSADLVHCDRTAIKRIYSMLEELTGENCQVVILDSPVAEDQFLLAEAFAAGHQVVTIESATVSIMDVEKVYREMAQSGVSERSSVDVVLTNLPFSADIFSFKGLIQLAVRFVVNPFGIKRKQRAHRAT